ncbi:hypothetical protein FGG08_000199 [Glutinoglossum americanum]|uniref:Heterokaryon incompatibility domain-containing protein n=1 Tax=Glutinoglossum americanum TaxID=1670608 RepID=A0A9P8L424_9PEZI|nr:hypothetical protein FGG08_000199 [Glutinoglossum americanum]
MENLEVTMRLINCTTLRLEEFLGSDIPEYAILSHTWGKEEVSFADFNSDQAAAKSKEGYKKISSVCKRALQDGLQYTWVDTCCIDKSSSAELSEAINSMFQWYKQSDVCYAYLSDVTSEDFNTTFPQSRWFRRGWTLQELLAPLHVVFFDQDWHDLGTKRDYATWISKITRIDKHALCSIETLEGGSKTGLGTFCVAKRMSWASDRETTRVEDVAYCLLGIFNVNMPLLYGEGKKAFIRLQEEIIKSCDDDSILAWGLDTEVKQSFGVLRELAEPIYGLPDPSPILASSPKDFTDCHNLEYTGGSTFPFMMTNLGLQIKLPIVSLYTPDRYHERYDVEEIHCWIGLLSCGAGTDSELLGIVLWLVGVDRTTAKQVERIQFGYPPSKRTVLVGARVAAQAAPTKVTIIQHSESRDVREFIFGFRQVIINESNTIRDVGYHVSTASALDMLGARWGDSYYAKWNSKAKVLTVSGAHNTRDLLDFRFESRNYPDPEFSVLIRGGNAIVREGSSFSSTEKSKFYEFLSDHSQQEDTEDIVLTSNDGGKFRIVVTVREKEVYHWRILEVDVDAVNIGGMESMDVN